MRAIRLFPDFFIVETWSLERCGSQRLTSRALISPAMSCGLTLLGHCSCIPLIPRAKVFLDLFFWYTVLSLNCQTRHSLEHHGEEVLHLN